MARAKHPPGTEPFDVTLPDGFEFRTENEDHAAWLVASKVGLSPARVTVWAGRDS